MVEFLLQKMFFLLIAFFSFAIVTYSQTNTCDLNLQFFDIETTESIIGVNIKLKAVEGYKEFKANKLFNTPVFSNLNSGIYQVELNKKGYKKKIKKFQVDCIFVDNSNKVFEYIYLWKGNNREVVKLDSTNIDGAFGVGPESSETKENAGFVLENKKTVVNGKVSNLVSPIYPPAAKAVRASGQVKVQITIDEDGNVIRANALDGHALLRGSSVRAVRQSKFSPTLLSGIPVKVTGVIVYNFNPS